ncbi:hypothetical protein [Kitasatospora sp. NPDC088548]|uniref:hypothetical protein n=1 Tax=Kitasatospora sp. NPDC088548 TaxID=3364075 RepID=UPI0038111B14
MTTFTIHNDADADQPYVTRITRLLDIAAPLAEKHSRLRLPDRVTVRICTPDQVIGLMVAHTEHLLREAAESWAPGSPERTRTAGMIERLVADTQRQTERYWPTVQAAVLCLPGGPELAVMPAAHAESRASDRYLTGALGHELVHFGQLGRWPGMGHAAVRCGVADEIAGLTPEQFRAPKLVSEGHAQWVQRLIVQELCGIATADVQLDGEPEPTTLFLDLKAESPRAAAYDRGDAFVEALFAIGGYPLIDHLLGDEALLPVAAELGDPASWLERHGLAALGA